MAMDINEGLIIEKRLTHAQMLALSSPLTGTVITPTDTNGVKYFYNGTRWVPTENLTVRNINKVSDLPAPVGGVITLEAGAVYKFGGAANPITLSDELVIPGATIIEDAYIITTQKITNGGVINRLNLTTSASIVLTGSITSMILTYTGTGNVIESTASLNNVLRIEKATIIANNATIFSLTASATALIDFNTINFVGNGNSFGSMSGFLNVLRNISGLGLGPMAAGLTISNSLTTVIDAFDIPNGAGSATNLIAFGGVAHGPIRISKAGLNNSGAGVYAFNFPDTGITYTGSVIVTEGYVTDKAKAFAVNSYTNKTVGFDFNRVENVSNSIVSGYANALNQGGVSTTLTQNKIKRVNATYTDVRSERYIISSNGNMEYIGLTDILSNANISITGETGGAVATAYSFYVCKGNSTNTITAFADAGGGQVTVTTSTAHGYSNGDRIVIEDTTNYNDEYTISNVAASTFEITETFVATETGSHYKAQLYSEHTNEFKLEPGSTSITTQVDTKKNDVAFLAVENTDSGASFDTYNIHARINGIS